MKQQRLLLILLLVFFSQLCNAQWTNDPTNPVPVRGSVGNYPTSSLDVASDGNGGTLICWTDTRTGLQDVYAQKISGGGTALWNTNGVLVANTPNDYEYSPKILSDGNGGAFVIWEKYRGHIMAQHLSDQGIKQWNVDGVLIKSSTGGLTGVVSNSQNGFIVSWGTSQYEFASAQSIDINGNLQWNQSGVRFTLNNNYDLGQPVIASDGVGGIIAVGSVMIMQRINSSGQRLWGDSVGTWIFNPVWGAGFPRICSDGTGGAITVFSRARNFPIFSGSLSLYAQRINSNGTTLWNNNGIPVCNNDTSSEGTIATDNNGGVLITWVDNGLGTTFQDIKAQKINSNGTVQWGASGVQVTNYNDDESHPDIANDGNGGAFVCYRIFPGPQTDVYVQRISSNGTFQWSNNGIPAIKVPGNDIAPKISYHSPNSVVVTSFTSSSSFNSNIHCSKISSREINFTGCIQGLYSPASNQSISDTLKFYIRKSSSPYQILDSQKAVTDQNGFVKLFEPYLDTYIPYYIQVKHRNSLETWSNLFNFDNSETLNYNFTTSQSQAFGNNQVQVDNSPVTFALYSGDINQDGSIDLTDINSVFNGASNFVVGYVSTDVTGDGFVDLTDLTITFNNSSNFVSVVKP